MKYHWLVLCLVTTAFLGIGSFSEAEEDVPNTSVATNQTSPVNASSSPDQKLSPDQGTSKVPSSEPPADPAQPPASNPQNATANITSATPMQGTDSSKSNTTVQVQNVNIASQSSAAATQRLSTLPPVENVAATGSNTAARLSSNSPGGGTNQTGEASNQQTAPSAEKDSQSEPQAANQDSKALNNTDNPVTSIPAGTQPGQDLANPSTSESPKTYQFICDNCTCPAGYLQNPYIINCTGSLPGHYIPPWNYFMDTEGDPDVDNVHLILEHNDFQNISEIAHCTVIDYISFSYNKITSIKPRAFANLPALKRLSISHNNLQELHSETFLMKETKLSPIEVLDLSYNQLHYLHNGIFDALLDLAVLNLEGNPFNILDASTVTALNSLHSLDNLNLAHLGLSEVPLTMVNPIRHLSSLNLAYNKLTRVPEVVQNGELLNELVLSGNLMENLNAASFIELSNVKLLNISDMPNLKIIYKGAFFPLQSLEFLYCNNNPKLHTVEPKLFVEGSLDNRKYLNTVEFRSNNLTTLHKENFKNLDISRLDVRYNPFECSCLIEWVQMDARTYVFLNDTRCASPESVKGMLIKDVDFESAVIPCPDGYRDHASFIDINYIVTESFGFWVFVLLVGLAILVALTMIVVRNKPQWQYKIMRIVSPQRAEYRNDKYSSDDNSKVRYMRQFDDDQGFSEDVITEYCMTDRSQV